MKAQAIITRRVPPWSLLKARRPFIYDAASSTPIDARTRFTRNDVPSGAMRARTILLLAIALSGCDGATSDPGVRAMLQVAGATFVPGAMPKENAGPRVTSVENTRDTIRPGEIDKALKGTLERTAQAAAIGMTNDSGYWVVPAGRPLVETPDLLSFDLRLSFDPRIPDGPVEIVVRAVSAAGRFGPAASVNLVARGLSIPDGELVITLRWDTESDLDLHVVDPNGNEIWARSINSYKRPPVGVPVDPDAYKTGGILDFDSNGACVIDGHRIENVYYAMTPPSGTYLVRVDTFSLCGETSAHWLVEARKKGELVARARGTSTDTDTRFSHDMGAGVLALTVEEP